jgi:autotransporter-associated beta strand protein
MSHSSGGIRVYVWFAFALASLVTIGVRPAAAETLTYVGPDAGLWSNPNHWSPAQTPVDGDDLVFNSAAQSSNQDIAGLEVRSLTFSTATSHDVNGAGGIRLTHGLTKSGAGLVSIAVGVTIGQGQTWTIDGGTVTVDGLALDNATLQLAGDGTSCGINQVTGTGGITKAGAHTLSLQSGSTFAGPVTVDAGTLAIGHPNSLGAAGAGNATTINSGGTLYVQPTAASLSEPLTLNGPGHAGIGAALFVDNPAAFQLASSVTLDGPATIVALLAGAPGGTIRFTGPVTGAGGLIVGAQTTAVIEHPNSGFNILTFSATGGVLRLADGLSGFSGPMNVTVPANNTIDMAGHDLSVAALAGGGSVDLGPGGALLDLSIAGTSAFAGTISGTGTVRKTNVGELGLTATNSYSGSTVVAGGVLRIAHASALGVSDGTAGNGTTAGGGTLLLDGVSLGNEAITLNGLGFMNQGALRVAGAVPVSIAGGITFTGITLLGGSGAADLTLSGPLTAMGEILRIAAPLAVTVSSPTNAFTINTIWLDGGLLRIGHSGALDPSTRVTVNGGRLELDGRLLRLAELIGISGSMDFGTGGTLELTNTFDCTFAGTVSGTGSIVKAGTHPFRLTAANTFAGPVTVTGGAIDVAHAQALANSAFTVQPGGVLGFSAPATVNGPVSLAGTGPGGIGGALVVGADVTFTQATTIAANTSMQVGILKTLTFQGPVSGPLLKFGSDGTIVIAAQSHALGGVEFSYFNGMGGTLRLGVNQALAPSVAVAVPVGSTLDLAGFSQTLTGISGGGTIALGAGMLTANLTGNQVFEGTLIGSGSLGVNLGSHAFTLVGTHTMTGTVNVSGGSFFQRGVLPAAIIANGTDITFTGASTVGAVAMNSGAVTLNQINQPVTATGFRMESGAAFRPMIHDPAGTPATPLVVNGAVRLDGAFEATLAGFVPAFNVSMMVIANDGTDPVTGTFSGVAEGANVTVSGYTLRLSYAGGDGNDVTLMRIDPDAPPGLTYLLAEGATGTFFDTDLLIANPQLEVATAQVTFLPENGQPISKTYNLAARSRLTIRVDNEAGLESAAFSTKVVSTKGPLIVERTMSWDATGYGGHTDKATEGAAPTWYFAEGSEGFFRTFLLLANPESEPNTATVTFLRENEAPVVQVFDLEPQSRFTFAAADNQALMNRSFGIRVDFARPGMAERAMYFGADPIWMAGHESAGVTAPSNTWFLAEGATGDGFETFILVANPNPEPVEATFTFLPESGVAASITRRVEALSRVTVNIDAEPLPLPDGPVATQVSATLPVIAERAQYWPGAPDQWLEAHNSFGVTSTAMRWGLAEGRVGGERGYQTYILLANPGTEPAMVTITFLGEGSAERPADRIVSVLPQQRVTIGVDPPDPAQAAMVTTNFGAHIESTQPIAVERALYWNAGGVVWSAGTNATATRLP